MSVSLKDLLTDLISQFDQFYNKQIEPFNQIVAPINQVLEKIAFEVFDNNVTSDQIKLLLCFIGIIPLGFILFQIKSPLIRRLYSTILGFLLSFLVYGGNVVSSHIMTLATYILCAIFGRHSQKVVFAFCLAFLSGHHIYRQITDYGGWKIDVSVILMTNFCKLVSFAFCYSDGFKQENQLSKDQKERRIQKLPNIFSFFSYINFLGSAVAGPTFDYYEYDNFINLKNGYSNIPHPFLDTFKNLGTGIVYLFIAAKVLPRFPLQHVITSEYGNQNTLYKVVYYNVAILLIRIRYYAGWLMIQCSCASTGITYNDSSKKFDQIVTVEESLEFSHEVKVIVDKWNKTIQVWLKRYVYFRLYSEQEIKNSKTKASYAQYATILVSAFWHGFYPGYYLAFLQWAVYISVSKFMWKAATNGKKIFKIFEKFGIIHKVLRWFVCMSFFNSFGVQFVLLSAESAWLFSKNINFFTITIVIGLFAFFLITNWGQRTPRSKQEGQTTKENVKDIKQD
ncbi:hypothetical protein ABPG72_010963 [Tetrahymena utriculariae]